jgi:ribosome-associated protein
VPGEDLAVRPGLAIPAAELRESASRAGGPGGQNVNKVSTRVTLRWCARESAALGEAQRRLLLQRLAGRLTREGELVVHCGVTRSRARNRELARERLAALVREALRPRRARVPTRPRAGARERRLAAKRRRGELKRTRRPPRGGDAD